MPGRSPRDAAPVGVPAAVPGANHAVAFAYAIALPEFSVPLVLVATLVGFSRVRLGVHYPGDVVAGQAIAITTVLVLRALGGAP